jgi:hypothetical protein
MSQTLRNSDFQQAIDAVEQLSVDEQAMLIEIVRQHLIEERRTEIATEIAGSRTAYKRGDVTRGTAEELMKELSE